MGINERILFAVYLLCGPVAWALLAYFVTIGRERMNKLRRSRDLLPAKPPLVSVLIPAKDEGPRIGECLNAVLRQDYPTFEVIAINDRSTDETGRVMDEVARTHADSWGVGPDPTGVGVEKKFASKHPLRIVHIETLTPGWLGKCNALNTGAQHAKGDWLFFVDSDVRLAPDALTKMAALSIARDYDALSITTTIETHTFAERLMLPILAATWMTMFAGDQTNEDTQPDKALANGQAFLIRRSAYEAVGGHAAVKDRIVEDVELMRTLKKAGKRCRFMAGRELAATRMHTNVGQMFNGWARIFAGTSRGRVWPMALAILFLVVCVFSIIPAIAHGCQNGSWVELHTTGPGGAIITNFRHLTFWQQGIYWLAAAAVHWLLMTILAGILWFWTGNSPLYALLLPISIPIEIGILGYSIRKAISGKIDWRGSAVNVKQTSRSAK